VFDPADFGNTLKMAYHISHLLFGGDIKKV
jgi:hypothetical protein